MLGFHHGDTTKPTERIGMGDWERPVCLSPSRGPDRGESIGARIRPFCLAMTMIFRDSEY